MSTTTSDSGANQQEAYEKSALIKEMGLRSIFTARRLGFVYTFWASPRTGPSSMRKAFSNCSEVVVALGRQKNSNRVEHCSSPLTHHHAHVTKAPPPTPPNPPARLFPASPSTPPKPSSQHSIRSHTYPTYQLHTHHHSKRQDHTPSTSRIQYLLSQQTHYRLTDNIRLLRLLRNLDITFKLHQLLERAVAQPHGRFPRLPIREHVDLGLEQAEGVDGRCRCHSEELGLMERAKDGN